MFLQNTILGSDTILNLFHCENEGVTPTSSTVKLMRQQDTAPFWTVVATYDVLTVGAVVDSVTGLYGLRMNTSTESAGTMAINWTWVSPVTSITYTETAQFNIVADNNTILSYINSVASELVKRPFPDNVTIIKIAKALGIDDPSNPLALSYFKTTQKTTDDIYKMVRKINKRSSYTKDKVDQTKFNMDMALKQYDNLTMKSNLKELSDMFKNTIVEMKANLNKEIQNNTTDGKLNTIKAFDLWGQQVALMFNKVDACLEQLQEVKDNQVDFAQALPQMVAQEQEELMRLALQQMMQQMMQGQAQQQQQM